MQEIITYIIILASVLYAGYGIYKSIAPLFFKKKAISCAGGCSSCSLAAKPKNLNSINYLKLGTKY
jgi:hypothetical protein